MSFTDDFDARLKREVRRIVGRVQSSRWRIINSERRREYKFNWRRENALMHRAHSTLEYAVSVGKVVKPEKCQGCQAPTSKENLQGHHSDYTKPLDVIWLCPICHRAEHAPVVYV